MTRKPPDSYSVGYGKPPVEHRFARGKSGNPKGRPKGRRLMSLDDISVTNMHGRTSRITKGEALLKQLVNSAVQGDAKSLRIIIPLLERTGWFEQAKVQGFFMPEPQITIELVGSRHKASNGGESNDGEDNGGGSQ
jgi:hypothetical protein